ncbi:MAG: ABC-F family ATP-binding cassette domain-containing protein [Opitutales bacterium]|tara:strand:+ start:15010 stop:16971 length:1962 start_codon:yes stop_codon:yes gene_type:complete
MITLKDITLQWGERELYKGITGTINTRDRIGLVGSNGSGKTTLLKILNGGTFYDGGELAQASYVTVGYLPQDGIECRGENLYKEVESAFESVLSVRAKIEAAQRDLETLDPSSEAYMETLELLGEWDHRLEELDEDKLESKIEKVLLGLGFTMEDMQRDTGEFSGGWQMRIALAKLLLREPSLLLLDEPTNHLDLPSQRWLERYLQNYEGSLVIISHDQAFLDTLCNRTFELSLGKLTIYEGNYSFFEEEKAQRKALTEKAHANQQRMLSQQQRFIDRFRYKSSKAKQVQSRIKQLDKIERIELEDEESEIGFSFPPPPRSGQSVMELENVEQTFDDLTVFRNLDLRLERGDRVGIVGVNGAGKSTLLRILGNITPFTSGTRKVGHNVVISYFAQHQAEELDPKASALEVIEEAAPGQLKMNPRSILGSFLFRGDDVFKKVSVLSGGEKNRLALAKMLLQPCNCLLLDEPTNHLDMRSKRVLQKALQEYTGTYVIVSHDRSFLDPLVSKVWEVSPDGLRVFPGNVSEYLDRVEQEVNETTLSQHRPQASSNTVKEKPEGVSNPKEQRRLRAEARKALSPLKQKIKKHEEEIASLEKRHEELKAAMMDPSFFKQGETSREGMIEYEKTKARLEKTLATWEACSEELSKLESQLE